MTSPRSTTAKCVFVGDFEANKCQLLQAALNTTNGVGNGDGQINNYCTTAVLDNCTVDVDIGLNKQGSQTSLSLWDTTGLENYDRLLALIYPETDVFVICFSLASPNGWRRVLEKWYAELRLHCPLAAIVLVGTHLERRNSAITSSMAASCKMTSLLKRSLKKSKVRMMTSSMGSSSLKKSYSVPSSVVTSAQGMYLAEAIGASAYVECSISTMEGVGEVLLEAARAAETSVQLRKRLQCSRDAERRSCWTWLTAKRARSKKSNK